MLKLADLHVYYGGIHALKGVSINVPEGQIVTLIGANGAGKSSTLRAISGLIKNIKGQMTYKNQSIVHKDPVDIVKSGISMSPEGRKIFPHLSVLENLKLGAYSRNDTRQIQTDIIILAGAEFGIGSLNCSRACANAKIKKAAPCPAANSRCWPWAAP